MLNSIIFIVSATLIGYAGILNGILAHSGAPELSLMVEGTFCLGLTGVTYSTLSALKSTSG